MTLNVVTIQTDKLQHDPDNARKHSERNIKAIAGSLETFGQRKPLVVMSNGMVICGNGTLEAARSLGWTEIDVSYIPTTWTWEQIRSYALADNRTAELAEWDPDKLAAQLLELDSVGWELDNVGFEKLQPPTEELPTPKRRSVTCPDCGAEFVPE